MCGDGHVEYISKNFTSSVCLLHSVVSGILGFGLRRAYIRFAAVCVAASSEEILGKGRLDGNNSVVSENRSFAVLGV